MYIRAVGHRKLSVRRAPHLPHRLLRPCICINLDISYVSTDSVIFFIFHKFLREISATKAISAPALIQGFSVYIYKCQYIFIEILL